MGNVCPFTLWGIGDIKLATYINIYKWHEPYIQCQSYLQIVPARTFTQCRKYIMCPYMFTTLLYLPQYHPYHPPRTHTSTISNTWETVFNPVAWSHHVATRQHFCSWQSNCTSLFLHITWVSVFIEKHIGLRYHYFTSASSAFDQSMIKTWTPMINKIYRTNATSLLYE